MGQFCTYCGGYVSDMMETCPSCGKKVRQEKREPGDVSVIRNASAAAAAQQSTDDDGYTAYTPGAAEPEAKQESACEPNRAVTYKEEYERRYGVSPDSEETVGTERSGQTDSEYYNEQKRAAEERYAAGRNAAGSNARYASNRTNVWGGTSTSQRKGYQAPNTAQTQSRNMAYVSYLGILCLIPFFCNKDDPFVRFHAKQGLVLFIIETILSAVTGVGGILGLIWTVMGLVNVYHGEEKKLPVIGGLSDMLK